MFLMFRPLSTMMVSLPVVTFVLNVAVPVSVVEGEAEPAIMLEAQLVATTHWKVPVVFGLAHVPLVNAALRQVLSASAWVG